MTSGRLIALSITDPALHVRINHPPAQQLDTTSSELGIQYKADPEPLPISQPPAATHPHRRPYKDEDS